MEFRDYYATLGVARSATDKEIRAAYRKLARELHPDVNKDPKATERFKRVNEAYEVLKDPEKRSKYDRLGADWERMERAGAYQGSSQPFGDATQRGAEQARRTAQRTGARFSGFSDFFETFFGSRPGEGQDSPWVESQLEQMRREQSAPRKGQDAEDGIEVSVAEAVSGGERTMHITLMEPCATCNGTGTVGEQPADGGVAVKVGLKACPSCKGEGRQYRRRTLKVGIPKGVTDGSKIRVAGEGAAGVRGGNRGDLYLVVRLAPESGVEVRGRDIFQELLVRDYRAALGGKAVATGPSGRLEVTVPAGCPSGRTLRVSGKGIPALQPGGRGGDLYLRVRVTTAAELSDAEREAYSALAKADGGA